MLLECSIYGSCDGKISTPLTPVHCNFPYGLLRGQTEVSYRRSGTTTERSQRESTFVSSFSVDGREVGNKLGGVAPEEVRVFVGGSPQVPRHTRGLG